MLNLVYLHISVYCYVDFQGCRVATVTMLVVSAALKSIMTLYVPKLLQHSVIIIFN